MHLTFGLDLDQGSYPSVLTGIDASMGHRFVGPRGLLQVLETHCGLLRNYADEALRVALYAHRLAAGDSPQAFFHRSLRCDSWGTARTVLAWRDALIVAGWDGQPRGSRRLDDLAGVEAVSSPLLPAGLAERLRALMRVLPTIRLPVKKITHAEPLSLMPPCWRQVLEASGARLEPVPPATAASPASVVPAATAASPATALPPAPAVPHPNDLCALQRILLDPHAPVAHASGDGSVGRLCGPDPWQTANALAAWLAANPDLATGSVVVRTGLAQVLDHALHHQNMPALGSASRSPWRPAAQVLALAFAVAWKPLDSHRMLELLTLPVSPVPQRAAVILARSFREYPGVGGRFWKNAWEEAIAAAAWTEPDQDHEEDADRAAESDLRSANAPSVSHRHNSPTQVRNKLQRWLGPQAVAVYPPEHGIPREAARSLAARVAQWAEGRARTARSEDEHAMRTVARQAATMRDVLATWDLSEAIPRTQLEQMLDQVQSAGSVAFTVPAEAGHLTCVDAPGAILGDAPVVIWWNFVSPPEARGSLPLWSEEEVAALRLPLEDPHVAALSSAWRWRQPALRARRLLVLVTPDATCGRPQAGHPLYDEIRARFCPRQADENRVTRHVHAILAGEGLPGQRAASTETFAVSSPKHPPAVWQVPPDLIEPLPTESATSLESLLACPLQWTLRYALGLRSGACAGLSEGSRLKGVLAHDLLEELLPPGRVTMSPREASNRAGIAFDRLLSDQACPLLMAERTVERLSLRDHLARAASALIQSLRAAGVVVRSTEEEREVQLDDGTTLHGRLDLVLEHPSSEPAVILDLKFGPSHFYLPLLEAGTAVQLATYARLARGTEGVFPHAGYFSITSAKMLVHEPDLFADATVAGGPGLESLWANVLPSRLLQLDGLRAGRVTVAGHALAPADPRSLHIAPPCELCDFKTLCLVGEHVGVD